MNSPQAHPMREYPHLPALPIEDCFKVIDRAGMPVSYVAVFVGVSRVAVQRWRNGRITRPGYRNTVALSMMVYRLLRMTHCGHEMPPKPPKSNLTDWALALSHPELPDLSELDYRTLVAHI